MLRIRSFILLFLLILGVVGCQTDTPEATTTAATAVSTTIPALNATPTLAALIQTAVPTPTSPLTVTPTSQPTNTPAPTPVSVIDLAGATVPPGFSFFKFADIYRPTSFAFDANGRLYVTSFDGTVHILQDEDGDGRSDSDTLFASGFDTALGITLRPGTEDVYVSSNGRITLLRDENEDDQADSRKIIVDGLPTGLHQNDNIKFGSDGWLYMGLGSTCDVCSEADPRSATIMRFNVDSGEGEIIATGLRNPFDIAFLPNGDLFATDNGRDDLGLDSPFEELNQIVVGGDYGWPNCWNVQEGSDCVGSETAVAFFEPHSSANGLDFYTGSQFPAEYQNNAFVAMFGTYLTDGVGTGVARVQLTPNGDSYTSTVSWFAQWPEGRPLPLLIGPDGAIYVGDYINNAIYRISYGS
jgi:glucose/arabinose dehydrogenase